MVALPRATGGKEVPCVRFLPQMTNPVPVSYYLRRMLTQRVSRCGTVHGFRWRPIIYRQICVLRVPGGVIHCKQDGPADLLAVSRGFRGVSWWSRGGLLVVVVVVVVVFHCLEISAGIVGSTSFRILKLHSCT